MAVDLRWLELDLNSVWECPCPQTREGCLNRRGGGCSHRKAVNEKTVMLKKDEKNVMLKKDEMQSTPHH